jgi:hypothetical protein
MEAKMTELSPKALVLIREAGSSDDPSETDRARIRDKLIAQLGAGALLSSATIAATAANVTTSVGTAAATATKEGASAAMAAAGVSDGVGVTGAAVAVKGAGASVVAKVALAAVLASAVGIGTTIAVRTSKPSTTAPSQQPSALTNAPVRASSSPTIAAQPNGDRQSLTGPAEASADHREMATPKQRSFQSDRSGASLHTINQPSRMRSAYSQPTRRAVNRTAASMSRPGLDEELELIQAAHMAMRQGDRASALTMLDSHSKRFPRGALREEREATRAIALCELGRLDQGRGVAQRLLIESPHTPLAARINKSCGPLSE